MNKENINIGVIGMGYVGLPLANELVKYFNVVGYDNNKKKISNLKKYPYDAQKYNSENYIKNLVSNYKNITFYNKTLKYPEFYQKNQILLLFGCSSTFGYLASFHNPIIMVNLKNYFPVKKKLENYFKKSIFLVNYGEEGYRKLLEKLVFDKKYIYQEWRKKTIYRRMFYKKFLGID